MPSFLSDPYHCVKFVDKHIFSIINYGKYNQCGCTKEDALRLNKYWGYMINNNRIRSLEELQIMKVPLEHMFNNHYNFSADQGI